MDIDGGYSEYYVNQLRDEAHNLEALVEQMESDIDKLHEYVQYIHKRYNVVEFEVFSEETDESRKTRERKEKIDKVLNG